jgi:hypothetical protein
MGRADLIGNGKRHLVPAWQPHGSGDRSRRADPGRTFRTQHTGLHQAPAKKRRQRQAAGARRR